MTQARTEAVYNGARLSFIVAALCIGAILFEIVSYNVRGGLGHFEFFFGFVPFLVAGIVFAVGRLHLLVIAGALALICLCDTVAGFHLEYPALSWLEDAEWVAAFYPLRVILFALPLVCVMRWSLGRSSITGRPTSVEF